MKISDMKTQEIIELTIFANRNWDDEYSKKKLLRMAHQELKKRFDATLRMLEDRPDQMVTDGTGLFKNILLKDYDN